MVSRWARLNWSSRARWALTAAFWVLANLLLLTPSQTFRDVGQFLPFQDKIVHLAIFGVLAALIRWSIPTLWSRGWKGGLVLLVLMLYGAGTECLQTLFSGLGRSFEWGDILMDCIGVVVGQLLCGWVSIPAGRST
jgi:VanZ family protein